MIQIKFITCFTWIIHFIVKYDLKVVIAIFMNFLNQQNLIVEECEIDELNE
jgi:hypothetical protein